MKINFLKLFMLPLAAFTLASAAAVSTDVSHKSKTAAARMTAYIHNPTINDCYEVQVECEPGVGESCLIGSWTAYGPDGFGCNLQLKRVQ
ncbi:hypothetical protein [Flavobacterium sp. SM2513]|uniref:hypothetical protein n=1 Tax=Flavobacterium sp. SM2513 TaxID=3424766 RepID=UPI003D7F8E3E